MRLGIDFGTTHTVVAACDRGNYPVVGFTDADGEWSNTYPSIVAERRGVLRFGPLAAEVAGDPEWTSVRSFKRWLSRPGVRPDSLVKIGSTELDLLTLVSRFLAQLKADLIERSNFPAALTADSELVTVVATPAHARSSQRFLTLEAFRQAGFHVDAMVAEPSAAAVEYARRYASTFSARRQAIIVYDLGGGTFDASLLRIHGRMHDVVTSTGLQRAGGDDFDERLAELALDSVGASIDQLSARGQHQLLMHCRAQKERLNPSTRRVMVELGATLDAADRDATGIGEDDAPRVTTDDFYAACEPLISETIAATERMLEGRALEEIAGIYLVGGGSTLPPVGRQLRARFGRRVHRSAYPSGATAIGLAIAFDPSEEVHISERFARKFGVFRDERDGADMCFDAIFDLDTAVPAAGKTVATRTYRAAHNLGHYRFVECDAVGEGGVPCGEVTPFADVRFPFDEQLQAADVDLRDVEIARSAATWPLIEERYSIDANGIVDLTITSVDVGYQQVFKLGSLREATSHGG